MTFMLRRIRNCRRYYYYYYYYSRGKLRLAGSRWFLCKGFWSMKFLQARCPFCHLANSINALTDNMWVRIKLINKYTQMLSKIYLIIIWLRQVDTLLFSTCLFGNQIKFSKVRIRWPNMVQIGLGLLLLIVASLWRETPEIGNIVMYVFVNCRCIFLCNFFSV